MYPRYSGKRESDSLCVSGSRHKADNFIPHLEKRFTAKGITLPGGICSGNTGSPKNPDYITRAARLESFCGWSSQKWNPNDLSVAGFYYITGTRDSVRCFFCGCGIQNLENNDDPWIEHVRWSPNCAYIKQCQGEEFVRLCHNSNLDDEEQREDLIARIVHPKESSVDDRLQDDLSSIAARVLINRGYRQTDVENAIRYSRDKYGFSELKAQHLMEYLLDNRVSASDTINTNTASTSSYTVNGAASFTALNVSNDKIKDEVDIFQENRRLKEQKLCKICLDQEACVVFVPCGHLVACASCSGPLSICTVCRFTIREKVRVYAA